MILEKMEWLKKNFYLYFKLEILEFGGGGEINILYLEKI